MLIIYKYKVNFKRFMGEDKELLVWIKDGHLRKEILNILFNNKLLPSEISKLLNKHRASVSRTLNLIEKKGLIKHTEAGSRTKLYEITEKGKAIFKMVK